MLPLRHARLWRVLSVLILVFVLLAAMTPVFWVFDNLDDALSWFENADKWLHGLTFVVLSVWFAGLVEKRRYWLVAIGLLLFGFLVEFCQLQVSYRTRSTSSQIRPVYLSALRPRWRASEDGACALKTGTRDDVHLD